MRTQMIVLSVVLSAGFAFSQNKIDVKWHCEKATDEHKVDIGDVDGHAYAVAQGNCQSMSGPGGLGEKAGQYSEYREIWKAKFSFHGHFTSTTDSGDKIFYTYSGEAPTDMKKPVSNSWKIVGATGKDKGIKGSGSCTGKFGTDESVDWHCTGTYTSAK